MHIQVPETPELSAVPSMDRFVVLQVPDDSMPAGRNELPAIVSPKKYPELVFSPANIYVPTSPAVAPAVASSTCAVDGADAVGVALVQVVPLLVKTLPDVPGATV